MVISGYGTNQTAPAMPIVMQRNMVFMANFALAVNEQFKYDRYFQIQPNGPEPRLEFSKRFLGVALAQNPKPQTIALVGADAEYPQISLSGAPANLHKPALKTYSH